MKIYTVYVKRKAENPVESAYFVPEAFNWWAIIFPVNIFWSLSHRCWLFLALTLIYTSTSFMADSFSRETNMIIGSLKLAFLPFLGIWANDFWRLSLRRRGYEIDSVIAARDDTEAQMRYLENSPPIGDLRPAT